MDSEAIKVFVVDASEVWRKILINHINAAPDMEVVGEINSSQGSILMLEEINPDIIMLDVNPNDRMPLPEVITQLRSINPDIRIILCSDRTSKDAVYNAADKDIQDILFKPYKRQLVHRSIYECIHTPLAT